MSYVIKATLLGIIPEEPEPVTVCFPIPDEQYDRTIDRLSQARMDHATSTNCTVSKLDSGYSVLAPLKGALVNVDQLDYLAKRLDSFDEGEAAQFQAMACKMSIRSLKDFINLTFCCQRATVIADFNDLEQAGRDHRMNLNGGILPARNPNSWMSGRKPSSSSKAARGPSRPSASFMTMGCEWSSFTTGNISLRTYMTHTRWFWRRRPSRHRRKNRNTCIFPRPSVRLSGPYAGLERHPARTFSSKLK